MSLLTHIGRAFGKRPDSVRVTQFFAPFSLGDFSAEAKAAVWEKAQPMIGWDPAQWRVDHRGNPIFHSHYGDPGSAFGWEIGHILDPAAGGADDLSNLRPQQIREVAAAANVGDWLGSSPFASSRS
jgi:hypothetical protein